MQLSSTGCQTLTNGPTQVFTRSSKFSILASESALLESNLE